MKNNAKDSYEKIKCSHCLKLVSENEADNCDTCEQNFCTECLTYRGEKDGEGELAFCPKCEKN